MSESKPASNLGGEPHPTQRMGALLLKEGGCILLVVLLAAMMLSDAAMGDRPVQADHTAHFFRCWYFVTKLLPAGRFLGWSNSWFGGEPVGYLYPTAGYWWVAAVYSLGLGTLNLSQAYGVAIFLAYAFEGAAVYALGRYAFSRGVGLVAAALYLTDGGADEMYGGWAMTVRLGVWPNTLSVAFSTLALIALLQVLQHGRWRAVGAFGLLAGTAALLHPLQLINLPLVTVCSVLVMLLFMPAQLWRERKVTLLAAVLLAAMVAALWLLPYLSARHFTYTHGRPWSDLTAMGSSLREGKLIGGMWVFPAVLGLLGTLLSLFSRSPAQFIVGVLVLACLLLGAQESGILWSYLVSAPLHAKVEYIRFATLLRPFWFVAAGWAALRIFVRRDSKERAETEREASALLKRLRVAVAVLLITPLAHPFARSFYAEHIKRPLFYRSERDEAQLQEIAAWINAKAAEDKQRFFRVAAFEDRFDVELLDLGVELKVPLYKIGWTPAAGFKYNLKNIDPEILEILSVRYVLTPLKQHLALMSFNDRVAPWFLPTAQFGKDLFMTEFVRWNPKRYAVIDGVGEIEEVLFNEEEIVLDAAPGSRGKLRLAVSFFDRWQATRNGIPVDIFPTKAGTTNETAFMTVRLEPGRYRFRFIRSWPEKVGVWLFLAGAIASALLILFNPSGRRQTVRV